MTSERTYGNTSNMENKIRSRYSLSHANATYGREGEQLSPDCISCKKLKTGRIPNHKQCKTICGNNKQTN